jgi:D-tyrosyl-tRNA(Tyr) deacylase
MLVLLGVAQQDSDQDIDWLVRKLVGLRIFSDAAGKMNNALPDIDGEALIISQFTLLASTKKGMRPSFVEAAPPAQAIPLYEAFVRQFEAALGRPVATGRFGADMKVSLCNDGPVTIVIDTQQKR